MHGARNKGPLDSVEPQPTRHQQAGRYFSQPHMILESPTLSVCRVCRHTHARVGVGFGSRLVSQNEFYAALASGHHRRRLQSSAKSRAPCLVKFAFVYHFCLTLPAPCTIHATWGPPFSRALYGGGGGGDGGGGRHVRPPHFTCRRCRRRRTTTTKMVGRRPRGIGRVILSKS